MDLKQLRALAQSAIDDRPMSAPRISLLTPKKRPKGFPRGELFCETERGKVYSYDARKIIAWINKVETLINEDQNK